VLGDDRHERLQELTTSEWIEAGDWLVEDEQFGTLGDRQRQRQLCRSG
jgi:hypothetical protein